MAFLARDSASRLALSVRPTVFTVAQLRNYVLGTPKVGCPVSVTRGTYKTVSQHGRATMCTVVSKTAEFGTGHTKDGIVGVMTEDKKVAGSNCTTTCTAAATLRNHGLGTPKVGSSTSTARRAGKKAKAELGRLLQQR